ncbi:hypothetical protein BKA70DRAFT_66618 [Coprinopsis sp. MPI-PUGE-AT-0042]|nr:hypothetical protein BKA70DRAFT_66618 [Coprinopsis sp. MPI-PUGE-AT-0042]
MIHLMDFGMDYHPSKVTGCMTKPRKMVLHSQPISPPHLEHIHLGGSVKRRICAHLELTQDTNPSLLRMVLLAVDHGLHWTIINLMPMIALALVETIWGHTEATTLASNKHLGCPCLCSSAPSRRCPTPLTLLFATTLVTNIGSACRLSRCPFLVWWLLREARCRVAIIADTMVNFNIYPTAGRVFASQSCSPASTRSNSSCLTLNLAPSALASTLCKIGCRHERYCLPFSSWGMTCTENARSTPIPCIVVAGSSSATQDFNDMNTSRWCLRPSPLLPSDHSTVSVFLHLRLSKHLLIVIIN